MCHAKSYILCWIVAAITVAGAVRSQTVNFTSSNLPIVVINTHGQTIVNEPKITADMGIIFNGEGKRNFVADSLNHYNGKIGIEIRGSSSQMFPKKQYGVETRDSSGNDIKVSLFDMPAESDWILSAQYNDKTLMRDVVTYSLTASMGRYASRTQYCEVVLNGEYMGVYMLFEKIKRDKNRVNISKLDETGLTGDAVTGGYIIKIDKLDGSDNDGWNSPYPPAPGAWQQIFYQYHYPKPEDITPEQKTYIKNLVTSFEAIFVSNLYRDPVYGYGKYVDIPSMVDFFLVNEMTKNVDAYRLSSFLYKDRDSKNPKFFFGPVWDYNHGFGNSDYYEGAKTEGWELNFLETDTKLHAEDIWQVPSWWYKIGKDTSFLGKAKVRWMQLRKNELSLVRINSMIDSIATYIDEAQQRNFVRWPVLNTYVWPNAFIGGTYANEVQYMKEWIALRFDWMDKELAGQSLDVPGEKPEIPGSLLLSQNYPNPFNPTTTVEFRLPSASQVRLTVHDLLGKTLMTLVDGRYGAGSHAVAFDASEFPSGVYFYRLSTAAQSITKKMILKK